MGVLTYKLTRMLLPFAMVFFGLGSTGNELRRLSSYADSAKWTPVTIEDIESGESPPPQGRYLQGKLDWASARATPQDSSGGPPSAYFVPYSSDQRLLAAPLAVFRQAGRSAVVVAFTPAQLRQYFPDRVGPDGEIQSTPASVSTEDGATTITPDATKFSFTGESAQSNDPATQQIREVFASAGPDQIHIVHLLARVTAGVPAKPSAAPAIAWAVVTVLGIAWLVWRKRRREWFGRIGYELWV